MHPARTAGMAQPPHQEHRRPARAHDVPLVRLRRALWRVRRGAELQYPDPDPAAVFLRPVSGELGAVFEIWTVSGHFHVF